MFSKSIQLNILCFYHFLPPKNNHKYYSCSQILFSRTTILRKTTNELSSDKNFFLHLTSHNELNEYIRYTDECSVIRIFCPQTALHIKFKLTVL